jgi:hypothetical protein
LVTLILVSESCKYGFQTISGIMGDGNTKNDKGIPSNDNYGNLVSFPYFFVIRIIFFNWMVKILQSELQEVCIAQYIQGDI